MSVEFHCTRCGKLLRVPDEVAGKRAKCPVCSEVLLVPTASESLYQASLADSLAELVRSTNKYGGYIPTRVAMEGILGRTWTILKTCWGACLVGVVCYTLLLVLTVILFGIVGQFKLPHNPLGTSMLQLACPLVQQLVTILLLAGFIRYFLKLARGEPVSLALLFSSGPYVIRVWFANLLVGIRVALPIAVLIAMACTGFVILKKANPALDVHTFLHTYSALLVGLGFIMFIVAAIQFLTFGQAVWLVVDRNVGVWQALKMSRAITDGNKLSLFLAFLVLGIGGLLLIVVTLGLGLLIIWPFSALFVAVAYLMMSGQLPPE